MRRGAKFTPQKLIRWVKEERGLGTYEDYQPWHKVARSDPGSRGRSRLVYWYLHGRTCHFLSDVEYTTFLLVTMLPDVIDIREQLPLSGEQHSYDLCSYLTGPSTDKYPGTLELARELRIRHPVVRFQGETMYWVMSTDLVVTIFSPVTGRRELLAISVKRDLPKTRRQKQLLRLEREYWLRQGVRWLLITQELFHRNFKDRLLEGAPCALSDWRADGEVLELLGKNADKFDGLFRGPAFHLVTELTGIDICNAPLAFWQAVWTGRIPLDLRQVCRTSTPLRLTTRSVFDSLNPLLERRSSCL